MSDQICKQISLLSKVLSAHRGISLGVTLFVFLSHLSLTGWVALGKLLKISNLQFYHL